MQYIVSATLNGEPYTKNWLEHNAFVSALRRTGRLRIADTGMLAVHRGRRAGAHPGRDAVGLRHAPRGLAAIALVRSGTSALATLQLTLSCSTGGFRENAGRGY